MEETPVFSWQAVDTDVESVYVGTEMLFVLG
jgi:hypothetical protein